MSNHQPNLESIVKTFEAFNNEKNIDTLLVQPHASSGVPSQVGSMLQAKGYKNVDALAVGQKQHDETSQDYSCFRNVIPLASPSLDGPLELNEKQNKSGYEIIFVIDLFNGIKPSNVNCLQQLLSLVNSGGFLCWTMPNLLVMSRRDPNQFAGGDFDRYISNLCDKCKWLSVLGYPRSIEQYALDEQDKPYQGLFYAMQAV